MSGDPAETSAHHSPPPPPPPSIFPGRSFGSAFESLSPIDTDVSADALKGTGVTNSPSEYRSAPSLSPPMDQSTGFPTHLGNSTSTSGSTSSSLSMSKRNSQQPFSPTDAFGSPFSYNDLPDPGNFGEPTLSFMTWTSTATGAGSSTISTARNSEIEHPDGVGPRVARPRGSAGGSSSAGVGSPGLGYGDAAGTVLMSRRLSSSLALTGGKTREGSDPRVYSRVMGLPIAIGGLDERQIVGMERAHDSAVEVVNVDAVQAEGERVQEDEYGRALEGPADTEDAEGTGRARPQRSSYTSTGAGRPVSGLRDVYGHDRDRQYSDPAYPVEFGDEAQIHRPGLPANNASYSTVTSSEPFEEDAEEPPMQVRRPSTQKTRVSSRTVASLRSLHQRSRSGTMSTMASTRSGSEESYGHPLEPGVTQYNRPSPLSRRGSVQSGNASRLVNLNSDASSSPVFSRDLSAQTSLSNLPSLDESSRLQFYDNSAFEFDVPDSRSLSDDEDQEDRPARAVDLAEDGKSQVIDAARLMTWGGLKALRERLQNELKGVYDGGVVEEFSDITHITLPSLSDSNELFDFLETFLPLVSSTLVVLDVSSNRLGRLPPSLARCHGLEELNLSYNHIMALPSWIGSLRNLRVLLLEHCGLQGLPATLMYAPSLHTISARHNRLISLPSWLSQLSQLETLCVDGNPFSGQWKRLIESILSKPLAPSEIGPHGHVPPVHADLQAGFAGVPTASVALPAPIPSLPQSPFNTNPPKAGRGTAGTSSGGSSLSPSGAQGKMQSRGTSPTTLNNGSQGRAIKRMRSAGALLGVRLQAGKVPLSAPPPVQVSTGPQLSQTSRMDVLLPLSSEADNTASQMTGPRSRPSEPTQAKAGKWGFLRKMSMNKIRANGAGPISRPPLPTHTNSDPLQVATTGQLRPPPKLLAQSAMTLPTLHSLRDAACPTEFGTLDRVVPSPAGLATSSKETSRERRRSFLSIDQPPKLNIAIPSISPLIPTAEPSYPSAYPSPAGYDSRVRPELANGPRPEEHAVNLSSRPLEATQPALSVAYVVGLKSIMSYLADLYDLSLPVPVFQGGAEVVHNDNTTTSDSLSEARSGSPSPHVSSQGRFSSINGTGGLPFPRKPILDTAADARLTSVPPAGFRDPIGRATELSAPTGGDPLPSKRYKDDSATRTGVIRHILETERSYVNGLRDLIAIYVKPANARVNAKSTECVIPANEAKIVFGGIEGIYRFHHDSFLPSLEVAAKALLVQGDDSTGDRSRRVARAVGDVFKRYHPFMRQYSAYINNFDFALARLVSWTVSASSVSVTSMANASTVASGAASATAATGVGLPSNSAGVAEGPSTGHAPLTIAQRKRIKAFLKDCRRHPKHTQLNLESYLLLPVQRIPRYRMLLDDLTRSTAPMSHASQDPIEIALLEMEALASMMNEEKRDSESRRRLVQWQARIRGKFATPLVRAHRRLLLDGELIATRTVRRTANFVEVPRSVLHSGTSTPHDHHAGRSGFSTPLAAEEDEDDSAVEEKDDKENTITGLGAATLPSVTTDPRRRKSRPDLSAVLTSRPTSPGGNLMSPLPQLSSRPFSGAHGDTTIVQIEALEPEVRNMRLSVILTSDLIVLCRDITQPPLNSGSSPVDSGSRGRTVSGTPSSTSSSNGMSATAAIAGSLRADAGDGGQAGMVDLVAVLKLQTKRRPASVVQGNVIRLVDNRCIWYLSAKSPAEAGRWVRLINDEFEPVR